MSDLKTVNNLITYIYSTPKLLKKIIPNIIICQCSVVSNNLEKLSNALKNIQILKDEVDNEELIQILNEILTFLENTNDVFSSSYKQKNLLVKINKYFEYCYENVIFDFDEQIAILYYNFLKNYTENEFGYSLLTLARYYMSILNYEKAFEIFEIVIDKFHNSKYEYCSLCDLLEIYKAEYQALERNNEDFYPVVDKITQILLYIIKNYSYQFNSFYQIIRYVYIVFRYERGINAISFFEKLSNVYNEVIYEEDIKLEFVNYYIGRQNFKNAIIYLEEFEKVFPTTSKKHLINLYKFECYVALNDIENSQKIYKLISEKHFNNSDFQFKYYTLILKYASILSVNNNVKDSLNIYEHIYNNVPIRKLKEEALYKLITLNINYYFDNHKIMPSEVKQSIISYCNTFLEKFSNSNKTNEIKLILQNILPNNLTNNEKLDVNEKNNIKQQILNQVTVNLSDINNKVVKNVKVDEKIEKLANKSINDKSNVNEIIVVKSDELQNNNQIIPNSNNVSQKINTSIQVNKNNNTFSVIIKLLSYIFILLIYIYFFFINSKVSITIFYFNLILGYLPFLFLTSLILFSLLKKIKIFE